MVKHGLVSGSRGARAVARTMVVCGVAAAAIGVAACGGGGDDGGGATGTSSAAAGGTAPAAQVTASPTLIKAAKKEGSVTFYAAIPQPMLNNFMKAFQKQYGITVKGQALVTGPLTTRLDAEVSAHSVTADVVDLADRTAASGLADKNAFAALGALPEYKLFPSAYKTPNLAEVSLQAFGVVYNNQTVKPDDLKTWDDVVNPKYKGRVAMIDIRPNPSVAQFMKVLQEKFGDAFIQRIGALKPTPEIAATPTTQQVVSGGALIAFPANPASLIELKAAGAPLDIVQPAPTTGPAHFAGVMAQAPHPNAARLLMNYLLSKTGQAAYNGGGYGFSAVKGIPGLALPPGYVAPPTVSASETAHLTSLLGLK